MTDMCYIIDYLYISSNYAIHMLLAYQRNEKGERDWNSIEHCLTGIA